MVAKSFYLSLIIGCLLLLGGAGTRELFNNTSIVIQSLESKTTKGHPVFNKISWSSQADKDVWIMNQSHDGLQAPLDKWDKISIVVDKTEKPYVVSYQQYENGKEIELKASCFVCHANGPRIIRPDYESSEVKYSVKDRLVMNWMNFTIKLYGKVSIAANNFKLRGKFRTTPLRYFGKNDTDKLKVKTCMICHNSNTFWGRGELERQHMGTIKHLVQNKQMPPWPFKLNSSEEKEIENFISGF